MRLYQSVSLDHNYCSQATLTRTLFLTDWRQHSTCLHLQESSSISWEINRGAKAQVYVDIPSIIPGFGIPSICILGRHDEYNNRGAMAWLGVCIPIFHISHEPAVWQNQTSKCRFNPSQQQLDWRWVTGLHDPQSSGASSEHEDHGSHLLQESSSLDTLTLDTTILREW